LTMEEELLIYLFCHKKNDTLLYKLLYYEVQEGPYPIYGNT